MTPAQQDSAIERVSQPVEAPALPNVLQPIEVTTRDTPSVRERRRPARESGLREKVVVITGAGAGIGRATALRFAEEGARIAAWDVSDKAAAQLESAIKWAGGESQFQTVDVTKASAVEAAAAMVIEEWDRIDILINNAGIVRDAQLVKWNGGSPASTMSEDTWDSVVQVNLKGVFLCTRAVVPHMIKNGGGVILCAASVVGLLGNFGQTNYVASKAGVIGMTRTWARESESTTFVLTPLLLDSSLPIWSGLCRKKSCTLWLHAPLWDAWERLRTWPIPMSGWRLIKPALSTVR